MKRASKLEEKKRTKHDLIGAEKITKDHRMQRDIMKNVAVLSSLVGAKEAELTGSMASSNHLGGVAVGADGVKL
ncbi:hypothetical protein MJD09_13055 [bacterium]|nr:hypothetical protein [bacterium]